MGSIWKGSHFDWAFVWFQTKIAVTADCFPRNSVLCNGIMRQPFSQDREMTFEELQNFGLIRGLFWPPDRVKIGPTQWLG